VLEAYRSIANRSSFHGRFARNSNAATAKGAQAQTRPRQRINDVIKREEEKVRCTAAGNK
jgi:hypothetical protein